MKSWKSWWHNRCYTVFVRDVKSNSRADGFTMVELLVVIAIISILAALLLPALNGGKQRAKRIVCETQLQQIGIAFQSFAHDHNSKFPPQVSTNDSGAMEYFENGDFTNTLSEFRDFQPLGGSLSAPKLLVCPTDTKSPAASFYVLQNSNVSYFAGVNAQYDQPMSILAGDGNLAASSPLLLAAAGTRLTWNSKLHEFKGNVLFSDGHVEEWKDYGGPTLAATVTVALPVGNSGGGGGGQPPQPTGTMGGGVAVGQPNPAGQGADPESNSLAAPVGRTASPPAGVPSSPSATGRGMEASTRHGNLPRNQAGQSQSEEANIVADDGTVTNAVVQPKASVRADDDSMSPANRRIAVVLRDSLVGSYLLILLLVLAYAAYRTWRWRHEVERKRRLKLAREQLLSDG